MTLDMCWTLLSLIHSLWNGDNNCAYFTDLLWVLNDNLHENWWLVLCKEELEMVHRAWSLESIFRCLVNLLVQGWGLGDLVWPGTNYSSDSVNACRNVTTWREQEAEFGRFYRKGKRLVQMDFPAIRSLKEKILCFRPCASQHILIDWMPEKEKECWRKSRVLVKLNTALPISWVSLKHTWGADSRPWACLNGMGWDTDQQQELRSKATHIQNRFSHF